MNAAPLHVFRGFDLVIRSGIIIPGAMPAAASVGGAVWDADIRIGPAALEAASTKMGPFYYAGSSLLFEMPKVARYLCEDGHRLSVEPDTSACELDVVDFLVATALPALLWQRRGEVVLHSAGVVPLGADRAVAICGLSGSGKSTVLKALLQAGASVVGDDTLRVISKPEGLVVSGLPGQYCWDETGGEARVRHAVPPDKAVPAAPLSALFILDRRRTLKQASFFRLSGTDALKQLLAQRHRPQAPVLMRREGESLELCAKLTKLPVYSWHRGEGCLNLSEKEHAFLSAAAYASNLPERYDTGGD